MTSNQSLVKARLKWVENLILQNITYFINKNQSKENHQYGDETQKCQDLVGIKEMEQTLNLGCSTPAS